MTSTRSTEKVPQAVVSLFFTFQKRYCCKYSRLSNFLLILTPEDTERIVFGVKFLKWRFLMDLRVVKTPESKNHIISF